MGEMLYRKVGRTGDEVSVIGIGTSSNGPAGAEETARAVTMALDMGSTTSTWPQPMVSPSRPSGRR